MDKQVLTLLNRVCERLGNSWRLNHIHTEKSFACDVPFCTDRYCYYIYNDDMVFIRIKFRINGASVLSIGFLDNLHFICDTSVNISLNKSFNSVVSDINRRLLCELDSVLCSRNKRVLERQQTIEKHQFKALVISSIRKAIKCDVVTDSYSSFELIREERLNPRIEKVLNRKIKQVTKARLIQHDKGDKFHLDLYDLDCEQVIKVLVALDL